MTKRTYVVLEQKTNNMILFCVFNTLSQKPHSFWPSYKEAYTTASDLNKHLLD